jgi:hypothetical protein
MQRRTFLTDSFKYAAFMAAVPVLATIGCSVDGTSALRDDDDPDQPESRPLTDMPIFGYFQAYTENETLADRDLNRTDGTKSGVLTADQAAANEPVTLQFWHGHGEQHEFTLTEEHFDALRRGETVYVLTTMVAGHKHCARITPQFAV